MNNINSSSWIRQTTRTCENSAWSYGFRTLVVTNQMNKRNIGFLFTLFHLQIPLFPRYSFLFFLAFSKTPPFALPPLPCSPPLDLDGGISSERNLIRFLFFLLLLLLPPLPPGLSPFTLTPHLHSNPFLPFLHFPLSPLLPPHQVLLFKILLCCSTSGFPFGLA